MSEFLSGFMSSEEQSAVAIVEKMAAKAEEDLTKLDGHMEYKHYAVMFENPTSSVRLSFGGSPHEG